MKRFLLTAMIAGLLAPAGLYAQEVYKDGSRVVLDLTVEAGMPADAITSDSKTDRYVYADPQSPGTLDDNHIQSGIISKKVYRKLEIAPKDLNASGAIGVGASDTFSWMDAFNFCRSLSYDGGKWRLPIQRELMLMYIFSPALNAIFEDAAIGGTRFSEGYYWSATEGTHTDSWYVSFPGGNTYFHSKSRVDSHGYVRCVREIQ